MNNRVKCVLATAGLAVALVGTGAGVASANVAAANDTSPHAVYEAKTVSQHVVLGGQSSPTTLVTSPALPGGTYEVSAIVGGVISPNDQIVCAAYLPGQNDGVFGTAGNGASAPGGVYGTAAIADTVTVAPGQRVALTCNSFNPGRGSYASDAVLELRPAAVYH